MKLVETIKNEWTARKLMRKARGIFDPDQCYRPYDENDDTSGSGRLGYAWRWREMYEVPREKITRKFIRKFLEEGLGLDVSDEKNLDLIMATGFAISERDYSRSCAFLRPFPPELTDKKIHNEVLPRLAISLVREHRTKGENLEARFNDYLIKLKGLYERAADKFHRGKFLGC